MSAEKECADDEYVFEEWQCENCGGVLNECECEGLRCGCKYCFCVDRTKHGEPCGNCSEGAHQG